MKAKYLIFPTLIVFLGLILISYFENKMAIYVSPTGSDLNPGTYKKPYKTIQHAANIARPGTTIKILPGIYRESVKVFRSGLPFLPITFTVVSNDWGEVIIVGSEPSESLNWQKCDEKVCQGIPKNIFDKVYYTKLTWTEIPYLVYERISDRVTHELHIARTPNFQVTTDWKYHEHWWTAEDSTENLSILKDRKLKSAGDLTGATIYMIDGGDRCGQFLYTKKISHFNKKRSEITFEQPIGFSIFGSQENGISQYTKYYIEGKLHLLDTKGEWLFDPEKKILYLWPLEEGDPKALDIEIAQRDTGFDLSKASHVKLEGLNFQFINENRQFPFDGGAIVINPKPKSIVKDIALENLFISYSANGISLTAHNNKYSFIEKITIKKGNMHNILRSAIYVMASALSPSNIREITVADSQFYDSGFKYNDTTLDFTRSSNVWIINNYIHDTASYGIHFRSYEKRKGVSRNITVEKNKIERTCKNTSACSAVKMYGGDYENTTVKKNILRDTIGWSYCQEKKNGSDGFSIGLFVSNASGITAIENFSNNHTSTAFFVYPRQLKANNNSFIKNFAGQSGIGLELNNHEGVFDYDPTAYATRHDNTMVKNNIFWKNNIGIELDPANAKKLSINHNIYIDNAADMKYRNIEMKTVTEIQRKFPFWDDHSFDADSYFLKKIANLGFSFFSDLIPH